MAIITNKTRAAAALDAILAMINGTGGPVPGKVNLYTGTAPANISIPPSGTLLAACLIGTGANPAFGATDTTTLIATGDTSAGYFAADTNPPASGTIGYWRMQDFGATDVLQGTVGVTGTVDITFNSLTVTAGILVVINTMTVQINGIT